MLNANPHDILFAITAVPHPELELYNLYSVLCFRHRTRHIFVQAFLKRDMNLKYNFKLFDNSVKVFYTF